MIQVQLVAAWLVSAYLDVAAKVRPGGGRLAGGQVARGRLGDDRGDVPGWVMVTVMTAALVVAILGVFRGRITDAISAALDSVTGAANG
jgi:hypothetical protein